MNGVPGVPTAPATAAGVGRSTVTGGDAPAGDVGVTAAATAATVAPATTTAESELEGGFSRRVVTWMAVVAALSLAAAALFAAFGVELVPREMSRPSSWSEGALGHRALFELLAAEGLGVVTRQGRAAMGIGPRCPLVLADPDPDTDPGRWERGRHPSGPGASANPYERDALARQAVVVLVLPKWRGDPDPRHPGWVAALTLLPEEAVLRRVERTLGGLPAADLLVRRVAAGGGGLGCRMGGADAGAAGAATGADAADRGGPWSPAVDLGPAQLIRPQQGLRPVVACRDGWLAAWRPADAEAAAPAMLLVADPDLIDNQGLGRADHAALVTRLLTVELQARGVVFDETIHGYHRANGLLAEALRMPLLPATLQGLLVLGLVLWAGAGRFGKPLPALRPPAPGKAVLIDNTAELLVRGGHAADSLARYYRYTLQAVAAHYFLPPDLPPAELVDRLAKLAARPGAARGRTGRAAAGELPAIERRIRRLGEADAGRRGEERAAALALSLYRWRMEMTDGARQGG